MVTLVVRRATPEARHVIDPHLCRLTKQATRLRVANRDVHGPVRGEVKFPAVRIWSPPTVSKYGPYEHPSRAAPNSGSPGTAMHGTHKSLFRQGLARANCATG